MALSLALEKVLLDRVRENTGLQNVGLLALEVENGSVNRDTWTSSFRDVMYALDYPQQVGEPPVITQPEVIPGTVVQIPDPNLRTAIAAELDKSLNAPITAEEMKRLRDLDVRGKGVRDLTGLQFATHLKWLRLSNNQVSDLSPIAGLIELRELRFDDNAISDLSPVRGLIDLTRLEIDHNQVSDLSPVRNLKNLTILRIRYNRISDLSPVAGLINLKVLHTAVNTISDISPIARLINLEELYIENNSVSDLSPVIRLTNLEELNWADNAVSDLSPVAGLINLKHLNFRGNNVSDVSPLARLINLEHIRFSVNEVSDITPFARLVNLKTMRTWGNPFSDLSPLAGLTNMEMLDICGARLQGTTLAPLAGLTGLKDLYLAGNGISDISPIARLTGLERLSFHSNDISDISPLAGLTNLKWLGIDHNDISDFSPLARLHANTKIDWQGNPGFPRGGPKIEGPWLWAFIPDVRLDSGADLLAQASGGAVTEMGVATQGATLGKRVGAEEWTADKLPPTGGNNLDDMLKRSLPDGVIYGTVSLYSPREQETTLYVGGERGLKVWLNGALIHKDFRHLPNDDYSNFLPVTLQQGKNVLLVAVATRFRSNDNNAFFGFEPGTEYTLGSGIGYAFSKTPIHLGDTFTFDVRAENVTDLAGWQFDMSFDRAALEAIEVSEGDFLKADGSSTFFQSGRIDNASGKIAGLSAARLGDRGAGGSGSLLQVEFKSKSIGETKLALQNFEFGAITGEIIPAAPTEIYFTVEGRLATGDVNRDGRVSILDLILVARLLGQRVAANSPEDVNGDGIVNIFDLTLVAQGIGGAAAPSARGLDSATVEAWIAEARIADDGSIAFAQGIANLENLLASLIIPQETALLANYPNPFNPESWIPYQLAVFAEVTLTIYDMHGGTVRRLEVGHQPAGMYQSRSRALYWDGRNGRGESVASGLYFYTLTAGDFTATRKMLIRK